MRFIRLLLFFVSSMLFAQNYGYGVNQTAATLQGAAAKVKMGAVIRIPSNFSWRTIPANYKDHIWEITDDFDLKRHTVVIPENVTLRFKGGVLTNGQIKGLQTTIESDGTSRIFENTTFQGSFKNEYITPRWFGAAMDGKTDDRNAFVETLAQAKSIDAKVMIDRHIFLDVKETGKKSIFLENNAWIEGDNGAQIIINNLFSPAFYIALTKNITIKNITFLYDQTYDPAFGWNKQTNGLNSSQIQRYLGNTKNIEFKGAYPIWKGPIAFRSIFVLDAPTNVRFFDVTFKAKGNTPNTFIVWAIKLKEQLSANQTVTRTNAKTAIPRKISLRNVTMDGVIMGIQGIVDGFSSKGLKSLRYSDVQSVNGYSIGGSGAGGKLWMPPPHLIYLNSDSSTRYNSQNIEILNTVDQGDYVGSAKVRSTLSGYCNSLKLVDNIVNVRVDSYASYRRDGLADLGNIKKGVFRNIYAENNSSIFDPSFKFNSLRFVGPVTDTSFENISIKDKATVAKIYPLDVTDGHNVSMKNIEVSVNELNTDHHGPFGINGSNNRVTNAVLNIKRHTAEKPYRAVVFLDDPTRKFNGQNNHFEVRVNGWRDMSKNVSQERVRILLQEPSNTNSNYAKVTDISNNFVSEQISKKTVETWTRSEVVTTGKGDGQVLDMKIPRNFKVDKITANTLQGLTTKANVSIGTQRNKKDLIPAVAKGNGKVSKTIYESKAIKADRPIYLNTNGNLQEKGKIEVTIQVSKVVDPK